MAIYNFYICKVITFHIPQKALALDKKSVSKITTGTRARI